MIDFGSAPGYHIPAMKRRNLWILFLLALLALPGGCRRPKDDRQLILDLLADAAQKTEKRDLAAVMAHLSAGYEDAEGRNKEAMRQLVDDYFRQFRGIVIHLLSTKISDLKPTAASLQTEVAVSSGFAEALRKVFSQWGECYRLTIDLRKEKGSWKVAWCQWEQVQREGLFPESLEILKNFFSE